MISSCSIRQILVAQVFVKRNEPPRALQSHAFVSTQAPRGRQQDFGAKQMVSTQSVPSPLNVPHASLQSNSVMLLHVPFGRQHAPVVGGATQLPGNGHEVAVCTVPPC